MDFCKYTHTVQYYETDTMKIVHHSNYIRWMEEARVDMLEQMGIGYDVMEREGVLSPVLRVECDYKAMTRFPETVEIEMTLTAYTGVRFEIGYIIRSPHGDVRATAKSAHCFIGPDGSPISLRRKFPEWDTIFRANALFSR